MGIRIFDGKVDNLAEQFFPELLDDAQAQPGAEHALGQTQQADKQIGCQHERKRGL